MDFERLRHFEAVARTLHFGRAAEQLNIDQSILSRSIKRLEEDLGVRLLDRSRRHVALTPAGQLFLDEARKVLEAAARAMRLARLTAAGEVEDLRVALPDSGIVSFAPRAIGAFKAAHPNVTVKLVDTPQRAHMEGLRDQDIDVVVTLRAKNNRQSLQGYSVKQLRRYTLVAAVPESWPVAKNSTIQLADLAEYPFILVHSGRATAEFVAAAITACRNAGFVPKIVQESWQLPVTIGLVAEGLGVTLILESTAHLLRIPGIAYRPVVDLPDSLHIDAIAISDARRPNPTVNDFISELQAAAEAELTGWRAGDNQPVWSAEDEELNPA
jgi:DNA-binding transcriptional LysR family regulator